MLTSLPWLYLDDNYLGHYPATTHLQVPKQCSLTIQNVTTSDNLSRTKLTSTPVSAARLRHPHLQIQREERLSASPISRHVIRLQLPADQQSHHFKI
jgi:hypothetical protein